MSRGVNRVIILGNLGQDPEIKYTPAGVAIAQLSIATSEKWTDKQTGQPQERTEWHRVVFFNRLAEVAGEYLRQGSKVYIEGSLRTRKWQDKTTGADRYSTDINGSVLQMLDSPNTQQGNPGAQGNPGFQGNQRAQAPQQAPQQQQPPQQMPQQMPPQQNPPPSAFDNFDDDIPF